MLVLFIKNVAKEPLTYTEEHGNINKKSVTICVNLWLNEADEIQRK